MSMLSQIGHEDDIATPRIFVSHSHVDEEFALKLATDFELAGAYVWIDKHNIKDGDFLKRINEGLSKCNWIVLVETQSSLTSPAVEAEVNAAQVRVIYYQMRGIIRIVAGQRDPRMVKPLWAPIQYYDATEDYPAAVVAILAAIRDGDARWEAHPPSLTLPSLPPADAALASPVERLRALVAMAYNANDWPTVVDRTDLLLADQSTKVTANDQRMRGRALLELGRKTEAATALKTAYDLDPYDLATVRAYCNTIGNPAEKELLLKRAVALADNDETRLDILREYVYILQLQDHWDEALTRIDQALALQPDDYRWLHLRLGALVRLHRLNEARVLDDQIGETRKSLEILRAIIYYIKARLATEANDHKEGFLGHASQELATSLIALQPDLLDKQSAQVSTCLNDAYAVASQLADYIRPYEPAYAGTLTTAVVRLQHELNRRE